MKDLTDKELNLFKIKKVKDYAEYIQKEVEYDLQPNKLFLDEMIELIIDIKRSVPNWKMKEKN